MREDDHSIAVMPFEQTGQQVELRRRGQGQCALLAIGVEGRSAFGRSEGEVEKLTPAVGLPHIYARLLHEAAVKLTGLLVTNSFLLGECHIQLHHPVLRQELAAELGYVASEDDRADELVEMRVRVVGTFGRGGQPEPERSNGTCGRQAVRWPR